MFMHLCVFAQDIPANNNNQIRDLGIRCFANMYTVSPPLIKSLKGVIQSERITQTCRAWFLLKELPAPTCLAWLHTMIIPSERITQTCREWRWAWWAGRGPGWGRPRRSACRCCTGLSCCPAYSSCSTCGPSWSWGLQIQGQVKRSAIFLSVCPSVCASNS